MRYLYVVICGLSAWVSCPARAQAPAPDSAQYEVALDERRVSSETDSAGTCLELLHWQQPEGLVRIFYPSGHLKEYAPCDDLAAGRRHGLVTTWFDNGQLHTQQTYWQGQRTGELRVYYDTGTLRRRTEYVAGNELPGSCFDPSGQPMAYFPYEQLPLYPGGEAQLAREITQSLRLPRQLPLAAYLEPLLVGVVFQVAEDGSIRVPHVARPSAVRLFDQQVLAAIAKLTRRFSPARRDGQLVPCAYYLPVRLTVSAPFQRLQTP